MRRGRDNHPTTQRPVGGNAVERAFPKVLQDETVSEAIRQPFELRTSDDAPEEKSMHDLLESVATDDSNDVQDHGDCNDRKKRKPPSLAPACAENQEGEPGRSPR